MEETPPLPAEMPAEMPDEMPDEMPIEMPAETTAPAPVEGAEAVHTGPAEATAVDSTAPAQAEAGSPAQPADLPPAACAAALAERFPALFTAGKPLPIKLRIQADIQARAPGVFSKKSLSIFLHRHTTSTPYIRALLDAPTRFDLDGQPAGDIATEHREAAVVELERRRQIVMAKRQAERDAQREAQRAAQREAQAAAPPTAPPQADRPLRPPRPDRPHQPPRSDRPSRPPRPPRQEGRFERPPQAQHGPRPPQPHRERPPAPPPQAPQTPLTPEQAADHEARRARALLLRAFETSTISRANFCTLKRIDDATLEAQLRQARAERGDRGDTPRR